MLPFPYFGAEVENSLSQRTIHIKVLLIGSVHCRVCGGCQRLVRILGCPWPGQLPLSSKAEWGSELLQLAAKQRMNTDVRRAIFCVIMGSDDCVDASERLLHLPLKVRDEPFGKRQN